jgi:hypothetical protein
MQGDLASYHKEKPGAERRYPQFQGFPAGANYYLAIGVLEIPTDARTMRWYVEKSTTGEADLSLGQVIPAKCYRYSITLFNGQQRKLPAGELGATYIGKIGPSLFPIVARVALPFGSTFQIAEKLPVGPAEVALGYVLRAPDGRPLREERSVLRPVRAGETTLFSATIPAPETEPSATSIDIGLVQERITWFNDQLGSPREKVVLVK